MWFICYVSLKTNGSRLRVTDQKSKFQTLKLEKKLRQLPIISNLKIYNSFLSTHDFDGDIADNFSAVRPSVLFCPFKLHKNILHHICYSIPRFSVKIVISNSQFTHFSTGVVFDFFLLLFSDYYFQVEVFSSIVFDNNVLHHIC